MKISQNSLLSLNSLFKMEVFVRTVNKLKAVTICTKNFILKE